MFQPCISDGFCAKYNAVFHPTVFHIIESAIFVGIIQENGADLGNIHLCLKADGKQHVLMKKGTPREIVFYKRIKQCLYVLVMFSPDVIKIVSWMLFFKCVKIKFAYLGKRLES